jgi:selenide,water dikinase
LLSDPQTSGGLLVSCEPSAAAHVLEVFARHGFESAAIVGEVIEHQPNNSNLVIE